MVAAKKGQPLEAVVRQVAAAGGPAQNGTTATEAVRFHDDLSTYTGGWLCVGSHQSDGGWGKGLVGAEAVRIHDDLSTDGRRKGAWIGGWVGMRVAEAVRIRDDLSTYTGGWMKGG